MCEICKTCEGFRLSNCCGAVLNYDICSECGEHADNMCENCDEINFSGTDENNKRHE